MKYYPAFLDLKDKKVVVAGGGRVAERKVRSLVKAGAIVNVISPAVTSGLEKLKGKGKIRHIRRSYKSGDIQDAFVVIAATSSVEINKKIAQDAKYLINVIDTPSGGNFIVPSFVERNNLIIAISTGGASPAVSKVIRKEIEKYYGREFAEYLRFVELIRKKAMKKISNSKERERFLKSLASEEIFSALRKKGLNVVSEKILASLNSMK